MKRILSLAAVAAFALASAAEGAQFIVCTGNPPGNCTVTVSSTSDSNCNVTATAIPGNSPCESFGDIATKLNNSGCCSTMTWGCQTSPSGTAACTANGAACTVSNLSVTHNCGGSVVCTVQTTCN